MDWFVITESTAAVVDVSPPAVSTPAATAKPAAGDAPPVESKPPAAEAVVPESTVADKKPAEEPMQTDWFNQPL